MQPYRQSRFRFPPKNKRACAFFCSPQRLIQGQPGVVIDMKVEFIVVHFPYIITAKITVAIAPLLHDNIFEQNEQLPVVK